jgi:putative ABC transport system permease protein
MRRVALKSIAFRKTRALLTAMAIVLGVSMISGTYVLTDTIRGAFTDIFTASYQDTSAVISGREIVKDSASGTATVPASVLPRVAHLPDVKAAAGSVMSEDGVKLLDESGAEIGGKRSNTIAIGVDTSQPRFNPLNLVAGRWAAGPGEVVLDKATAKKHHVEAGGTVRVSGPGAAAAGYRVTGVARYGNVDSLGGATIAVFTVPVAQRLAGKAGQFDTISVAARNGVSTARLIREVEPTLPRSAQIKDAAAQAAQDASDVDEFMRFFRYFLLAFAAIALFVGSFVIFNTLSITVAQRAREFATLRTMGASRRQIMRSVLLEGAIIGVLASAAGLALGLGLAKGLTALMRALALELPRAPTVFAPRTAIVSMAVGVSITLLATVIPAVRATRVPPIAAVREGATVTPSRLGGTAGVLAGVTIALALSALATGSFASGLGTGATLLALGGGVLLLFLGVAMVAPALVRPMAAVLGAPARRLGGSAGVLARGNATRNPARTASTAAALMIGLALVTVVATLGAGLRHSVRASLDHQVRADYVVTSDAGLPAAAKRPGNLPTLLPGVGAASIVLDDRAHMLGADTGVDGIDPTALARTYRFTWARGSSAASLASLGDDGAIVKKSFADKHHLRVGTTLTMTGPSGRRLAVRVRGIHTPPAFDRIQPVLAPVLVSRRAFVATFPRPKLRYAFVELDGNPSAATLAGMRQALRRAPGVKVQTKDDWVTEQAAGINTLLNLLYVLLALSIVVSLFGMVNTLILAVFERTRELGMLRAIGMSRRQVRRMVRHESTITALIGAGLGLPVGLFLAAIVTRALSDQGLAFAVPLASLAVFVAAAVVAGLVAAVAPARRASRLDVLHALHYE